MDANSAPQKPQARAIPPLGTAIKVANLAKLLSAMTPATAVCFCVIILLTLITVRLLFSVGLFQLHTEGNQDFMANRTDYIEFGRACLDVCRTLSELMNGKKLEDLSQAWRGAVTQLTTTVTDIQEKAVENLSKLVDAKKYEGTIAAWRSDLNGVLTRVRPLGVKPKL